MRYQIGQKIPVIAFIVKGERLNGEPGQLYERATHSFMPWDEQVVSSEIVYLKVTEHHRVPDSNDPKNELTCDGYILETAEGERWFNQYPRASYGQIDDSCNRLFHRENFKVAKYRRYISLFSYMENLLRGESQLARIRVDRASMLRTHYEELKSRYEETTGCVIVYEPHKYKTNDGKEHVLDDWFDITADSPEVIARKLYDDYFISVSPIPVFAESKLGLKAFVESKTNNMQVLHEAVRLIETLFDKELVENAQQ